jgi:ABC-type Fe3+/spermidine/putrescine transport system ATPase subunit
VALARALINHPALLLLDEPLGALDLKLRKQMQWELTNIQRQVGIAFVYVTHDQEEALSMSDRVAVMSRGHIVQIGTPRELYEQPASAFVADFIGENNLLTGRVVGHDGGAALLSVEGYPVFRLAGEPDLANGGMATVCLRPEKIRVELTGQARSKADVVSGRVSRTVYTGSRTYIHVDVGRGARLLAAMPGTEHPAVGAEVSLSWNDTDVVLLAPDEPTRNGHHADRPPKVKA